MTRREGAEGACAWPRRFYTVNSAENNVLTVLCLLSRAGCQRAAGPEKLPELGDQVWGTRAGCLRLGGEGGAGSVTGEVDRNSVELTDFRVSY